MNKVASYLQEHIDGEVMTAVNVRNYFSTDGSIFAIVPSMVVYPRGVNDVRKTTRFTWQLAEKGHVMAITARGLGSNQVGSAIGKGIVAVFSAHMNSILEMDAKQRLVRVQPGLNLAALQMAMKTHGLFFPAYPSVAEFSTVGGVIADNASGEKSIKYGATGNYIGGLEVVLANGELIQTERLSKRELSKKKGQTNFEGEVYRQLDNLITDNWDLIQKTTGPDVAKNTSGYNIKAVKHRDGSFDLTPLLVGSQGTLGIVTEAILKLESFNPKTILLAVYFDKLADLTASVAELLPLQPSAMEIVDSHLLDWVNKINPGRFKDLVEEPFPAAILLVEFDDINEHKRKSNAKKAEKIIANYSQKYAITDEFEQQQKLWSIRHSTAEIATYLSGDSRAVPILEDGIVPQNKLQELVENIYTLFDKYHLKPAIWGHAGEANLHLMPFLDLSKLGDRQKVFKLMNEYYEMIIKLGGSPSGEHNDGRLRGVYLQQTWGDEMYDILQEVKRIFDPFSTLNIGVKIDVAQKDNAAIMRREYSMDHLFDRLPRL